MSGCNSAVIARGWCRAHYLRWYKRGDPLIVIDQKKTAKRGAELPQFKHGLWNHALYPTWHTMMARCYSESNAKFSRYGGRGITVCERWHTPTNFIADMGDRPAGASLDRINNDGNYEPGNCRWATRLEQARNRPQASLTDEQRQSAIALYAQLKSPKKVAAMLGIGSSAVKNVVYGEKRRTVEKIQGVAAK